MIITDGHEYEALMAQRARHTTRVGRLVLRLLGFRGQADRWDGDPTRLGAAAYHSGMSHMRAVHDLYEHGQPHEHESLEERLHDLLRELEHLHEHLHEHTDE
jgi:hypothetical protein